MIWLSAIGWLRSAFRAVAGLYTRYPLQVALCAALLACAWLWHGWNRERADYAAYRHQAAASVLRLEQEKAATEARRTQITKDTDHATQPARDSALDAARRYAVAHRCMLPPAVAAAGPAGTGLPEPAATPGSPETPATDADMVAVSRADLAACTLNSTNLALAVQWAQRIYGED